MTTGPQAAYERLRRALQDRLGPRALVTDPDRLTPFLIESRGLFEGDAPFAVLPASTEEVAETVRLCAAEGLAVVPQGGITGRVGGTVPYAARGAVPVNLKRMTQVRALDALDDSMTVEAGCILADVQAAAAAAGRLFPLSLGAEGSCQIGGNLASNAGGIQVLRYGNMRDLVLGLEVVLADGRVWHGLGALRKDNTGYDLKQLFIGSEGTLGVITAATLKLFPQPAESLSLFIAVPGLEAALAVLADLRAVAGGGLSACELIPRIALDFALAHEPGVRDPLGTAQPWYLLVEATAGRPESGLGQALEAALGAAMDAGRATDATLAASQAQAEGLWRIREALVAAQAAEGGSIKHDIAVPVSAVPRLIDEASRAVAALIPGVRPYPFGHLGDGNIHFNFSQPEAMEKAAFMAWRGEVNSLVHDIALSLGGTISAEHGIGRVKQGELQRVKTAAELDLLRRVKRALDPQGIMNPGVILDDGP